MQKVLAYSGSFKKMRFIQLQAIKGGKREAVFGHLLKKIKNGISNIPLVAD